MAFINSSTTGKARRSAATRAGRRRSERGSFRAAARRVAATRHGRMDGRMEAWKDGWMKVEIKRDQAAHVDAVTGGQVRS